LFFEQIVTLATILLFKFMIIKIFKKAQISSRLSQEGVTIRVASKNNQAMKCLIA
jgi:hypothetical protein